MIFIKNAIAYLINNLNDILCENLIDTSIENMLFGLNVYLSLIFLFF